MKLKYLALPLALALLLSACGENNDTDDSDDYEAEDQFFKDGGQNDIGI